MSAETTKMRQFTRIPFYTDAYLSGKSGKTLTHLIDVSLKGALLTRPADWKGQPGDEFRLELMLGDGEIIIHMDASVAHIEGTSIGFRCDHIDYDSIVHLRRLMELNLGDAELVNRELTSLGKMPDTN